MESEIQGHAHSMATREPSVRTPGRQQKHPLDSLLPDDWAKQRGSSDALCLLQTFVEGPAQRPISTPDLCGDRQNRVKGPRTPLLQTLVGIICRIKQRDEKVTSQKESK